MFFSIAVFFYYERCIFDFIKGQTLIPILNTNLSPTNKKRQTDILIQNKGLSLVYNFKADNIKKLPVISTDS